METNTKIARLNFIDIARSVAILLMIEGHFTGAALDDTYRNTDYALYHIWASLHGFTKPLFFTVTGLIFAFLLLGREQDHFLQNPRIKKGFKRIVQLLFWGYLLQINLWSLYKSFKYGKTPNFDWIGAFHVLQSIALGIFIIIVIYAIHSVIKKGAIAWYFIGAAFLFLAFHGQVLYISRCDLIDLKFGIETTPNYWPSGAPAWIQNIFYGQHSDFSILGTASYTLLGAALGAFIKLNQSEVKKFWFGLLFFAGGVFISAYGLKFLHFLDHVISFIGLLEKSRMSDAFVTIVRFGRIMSFLGILIWIDNYYPIRRPLFLKIGQNTFAIYVIHAIILYGGIFGFGLKPRLFNHNLSLTLAVTVSVTAITFFMIMVKYIEPLEMLYKRILRRFSVRNLFLSKHKKQV
jgi:hypothetical protein